MTQNRIAGLAVLCVSLIPPVILLLSFSAYLLDRLSTQTGIDVDPKTANGLVHQRFRIPESASHVNLISSPRSPFVVFTIDDQGFRTWCKTIGAVASDLDEDPGAFAYDVSDAAESRLIRIDRGFAFDGPKPRRIFGVYDAETQRCYARFACRD